MFFCSSGCKSSNSTSRGVVACFRLPWLLCCANHIQIPGIPFLFCHFLLSVPSSMYSFWASPRFQPPSQYLVILNEFYTSTLLQAFLIWPPRFCDSISFELWNLARMSQPVIHSVDKTFHTHTQTHTTLHRAPVWTICPSVLRQRAPACGYLILWGEAPSCTRIICCHRYIPSATPSLTFSHLCSYSSGALTNTGTCWKQQHMPFTVYTVAPLGQSL